MADTARPVIIGPRTRCDGPDGCGMYFCICDSRLDDQVDE